MKDCNKLYMGFREYVNKEKLQEYDNEFFDKGGFTYKTMIPFILKYIDFEYHNQHLNKETEIFKFFKVYCNKLIVKDTKWVENVKLIAPTYARKYLFKTIKYN